MMRRVLLTLLALLCVLPAAAFAAGDRAPASPATSTHSTRSISLSATNATGAGERISPMTPDPCIECHSDTTPGVVRAWQRSDHSVVDVRCADCHGTSVEDNHSLKRRVTADVCGSCHKGALMSHQNSKHSIGMKTGQGCTRNLTQTPEIAAGCSLCHREGSTMPVAITHCPMFLAQTPEMQKRGCATCHRVENSCDTCHTKHGTDLEVASDARTCGTCHMGPDHAQLEMWKTSTHGVIFSLYGPSEGPTCTMCHMKGGSHDVSQGIATGKPEDLFQKEREAMVSICSDCHSPAFARRDLEGADAVERQSRGLLAEAQEIVELLNRDRLLMPMPKDRPAHPLNGGELVIGPGMLYEDISAPEALYFRMMMFHYMSAYKGAFHQNPDYTHWYGNAPLKLSLSELKSQAGVLRKIDRIDQRLDNLIGGLKNVPLSGGMSNADSSEAEGLKHSLRELKDRLLRKDMTEEQYQREKALLLDKSGL